MTYQGWTYTDSGSGGSYWEGGWSGGGYHSYSREVDYQKQLEPLTGRLAEYDELRVKLETEGGGREEIRSLTKVLNKPVTIKGHYGSEQFSIKDQAAMRRALRGVGIGVNLSVRQLHHHMPVYYLCRTKSDYWSEYSLVVEDLYLSPGYSFVDERFIKLMRAGHEINYLRLSPLRKGTTALVDKKKANRKRRVDRLLHKAGRQVLQLAWHEDQSMGITTAYHLGLPRFRQAVELLYLCLGADLCEVRGAVDKELLAFFEKVYPHPAIRRLLSALIQADGGLLNKLPNQALNLYRRLGGGFGGFLAAEVPWRGDDEKIPLWKLIYGNYHRLEQVALKINGSSCFAHAAKGLETLCLELMEELLAMAESGSGPLMEPMNELVL